MPAILQEFRRGGCYLVSEAPGSQSREVGVFSGGIGQAGQVLGRITADNRLVTLAPTATDGSQNAAAILFQHTDATAADVRVSYTARDAEVNGLLLSWPAGITVGQQNAAISQLLALGIIVRT